VSSVVVIDANIAVALAVPLALSDLAATVARQWTSDNVRLAAPTLWEYEVVASIRKAASAGALPPAVAADVAARVLRLVTDVVAPTPASHLRALEWADRLGQVVTYDGCYLALAEEMNAEFWTADQRLARRAQEVGAKWVHNLA
jgi:predicted nucleic acid-binding protein